MRGAKRALFSIFLLAAGDAAAGDGSFLARPDGHAPLGVMGDHMHHAGEVMLSYRWARMRMDGNRDGTSRLSPGEVLGSGYSVTPTDMDMEMHMFGIMAAPTDWLTLMAMVPYVRLSMDHLTGMGGRFTTTSDGVGDLRLTGLLSLWSDEVHDFHLNLGFGFPTGEIRQKDVTPAGLQTLPFPMQIGAGTFDLLPGLTYVGHTSRFSWGGQAIGTVRLDTNDAGWAPGDRVDLTGWLAVPLTDWVSVSGRVSYLWWGNHRGDESRPPPPSFIPTADPDRRAGQRIDLLPGVNLYVPLGPLGKHRFAVEGGFPVFQRLDGPQLETDWRILVGWQKAF